MSFSSSRIDDRSLQLNDDVKKLCDKILSTNQDDVTQNFISYALRFLSVNHDSYVDEIDINESINRQFIDRNRTSDAQLYKDLNRRLKEGKYFRNPSHLIALLYNLADFGPENPKEHSNASLFLTNDRKISTPIHGASQNQPNFSNTFLSSVHKASRPGSVASVRSNRHQAWQTTDQSKRFINTNNNAAVTNKSDKTLTSPDRNSSIPENLLIREVLYILMAIQGNLLQYSSQQQSYVVNPSGMQSAINSGKLGSYPGEFSLNTSQRMIVNRLGECGWHYSKVRDYIETRKREATLGSIGQSMCSSLQQKLTEYFGLVSTIEAQLIQESDESIGIDMETLTLSQVWLWMKTPCDLMRHLAALVDVCQSKKGGALASEVYAYLTSGNAFCRSATRLMLLQMVYPLFILINSWIYDGELVDRNGEFFVAANPSVKEDRLWHEKYSLRKAMVPGFIGVEQAKQILLAGKSISFLRNVCQERTHIRDQEAIKKSIIADTVSIFQQDIDSSFAKMVDTAYKETSKYLLEILYKKFDFIEQLKAMRQYLLLGQGDFFQELMTLLEKDLDKPAEDLHYTRLASHVDSAIRSTNAQYDSTEVIKRLKVRTLDISPGDTGWDVFSLDYQIDGPLATVFTPDAVISYLRAFNFLWRSKRMEFVLCAIWRRERTMSRTLANIPELAELMHTCQLLGAEMGHFVQQFQYYISFEVLECAWVELLDKVREAKDLDCIIAAHSHFICSIIRRCLLDEHSREILTQLRAIFDLIISYQDLQGTMLNEAHESFEFRASFDSKVANNRNRLPFNRKGDTNMSEKAVSSYLVKFKVLRQSYMDMVIKFLRMLNDHQDQNLKFLSVRLNYNQFYREEKSSTNLSSVDTSRMSVASPSMNYSRSSDNLSISSSRTVTGLKQSRNQLGGSQRSLAQQNDERKESRPKSVRSAAKYVRPVGDQPSVNMSTNNQKETGPESMSNTKIERLPAGDKPNNSLISDRKHRPTKMGDVYSSTVENKHKNTFDGGNSSGSSC